MIAAPTMCPDCGNTVERIGKPGRVHICSIGTRKNGTRMHHCRVPETILIPTCIGCGSEWMDNESALELSKVSCTMDLEVCLRCLHLKSDHSESGCEVQMSSRQAKAEPCDCEEFVGPSLDDSTTTERT